MKIRVWDSFRGEMCWLDLSWGCESCMGRGWIWAAPMGKERKDREQHDVGVCEFMRSTGLKDDAGVEIFEGDIVKIGDRDYEGVDYSKMLPVTFQDGCFGVLWDTGHFAELKHYTVTGCWCLVVGNVYENGELLK